MALAADGRMALAAEVPTEGELAALLRDLTGPATEVVFSERCERALGDMFAHYSGGAKLDFQGMVAFYELDKVVLDRPTFEYIVKMVDHDENGHITLPGFKELYRINYAERAAAEADRVLFGDLIKFGFDAALELRPRAPPPPPAKRRNAFSLLLGGGGASNKRQQIEQPAGELEAAPWASSRGAAGAAARAAAGASVKGAAARPGPEPAGTARAATAPGRAPSPAGRAPARAEAVDVADDGPVACVGGGSHNSAQSLTRQGVVEFGSGAAPAAAREASGPVHPFFAPRPLKPPKASVAQHVPVMQATEQRPSGSSHVAEAVCPASSPWMSSSSSSSALSGAAAAGGVAAATVGAAVAASAVASAAAALAPNGMPWRLPDFFVGPVVRHAREDDLPPAERVEPPSDFSRYETAMPEVVELGDEGQQWRLANDTSPTPALSTACFPVRAQPVDGGPAAALDGAARRARAARVLELDRARESAAASPPEAVLEAYAAGAARAREQPCGLWSDALSGAACEHLQAPLLASLRDWLASWKRPSKAFRESLKSRARGGSRSRPDSDDWIVDSEDEDSDDEDTADASGRPPSACIVRGPSGALKSACVHAAAAQLGFQVHEIHVGQSRSRAALVKEYSELALSQRINVGRAEGVKTDALLRGGGGSAGRGRKSNAGNPPCEQDRRSQQVLQQPHQQTHQQAHQQRMTKYIVLVDDADIVFEEDPGFSEWLSELIVTALCPVILTCSSALPLTARKDLEGAALELIAPQILPEAVASALRVTLAVEGLCAPQPGQLMRLVRESGGDLRQALHLLQFFADARPAVLGVGAEAAAAAILASRNAAARAAVVDLDGAPEIVDVSSPVAAEDKTASSSVWVSTSARTAAWTAPAAATVAAAAVAAASSPSSSSSRPAAVAAAAGSAPLLILPAPASEELLQERCDEFGLEPWHGESDALRRAQDAVAARFMGHGEPCACGFCAAVAARRRLPPPPPPAAVERVSPGRGHWTGNTKLHISGAGFAVEGCTVEVLVDGVPCPRVQVVRDSDLFAWAPPRTRGSAGRGAAVAASGASPGDACELALVSQPQPQSQSLTQGAEAGGSSDDELEMDFVDLKPANPPAAAAGDGSCRAAVSGKDEWGALLHGSAKPRRPLTKAAEALAKIAHSRFWPVKVTVRLWPAGGAPPIESVDAGGAVFEYCLQDDRHEEAAAAEAAPAAARERAGPERAPAPLGKAPCTATGADLDRMLELAEVQSWADAYARPPQMVAPRICGRSFAPRDQAARDSLAAAVYRPGSALSARLRAAATELAAGAHGTLAADAAEAPDGGAATELRRLAERQLANYALSRAAALATFGAPGCLPVLTPPSTGAALAHAHAGQASLREALPLLAEMARNERLHKTAGQRRRQFLHYFSRLGMPDSALPAVERWAAARAALQQAVARHDAALLDAVRLHDAR